MLLNDAGMPAFTKRVFKYHYAYSCVAVSCSCLAVVLPPVLVLYESSTRHWELTYVPKLLLETQENQPFIYNEKYATAARSRVSSRADYYRGTRKKGLCVYGRSLGLLHVDQ